MSINEERKHERIKVAIVDDDATLAGGLQQLLEEAQDLQFVAHFATAEDGITGLGATGADVLLLDIGLPKMNGADAVKVFRGTYPSLTILMLTIYVDRPKVFASLCAGANGYLLKSTPPLRLIEAIRAGHAGGAPLSPEIASSIVTLFQKLGPPERSTVLLTAHEKQLLWLLSQGYSYESAGHQMGITINTVRNHIRSVYEKLHVHSRSEAVTRALQAGLIG